MTFGTLDDIVTRVANLASPGLIAIDGLPVSGKSTLADQLIARLDLNGIYLDDFIAAPADWPSRTQPAFPFQYIRYEAFLGAIKTLAQTGTCSYQTFDWSTLSATPEARIVTLDKPVIIEGVSALHPDVAALYDLKIFVASDRPSTLAAAYARGVGAWTREWEQLFLPSADLYMRSVPQNRADLIYAGRGVAAEGEARLG